MQNVFHHVHRHIKQHHEKYLFGIFGGYAIVKLVLLVLWLSAVQYLHTSTFAQLESGCVMTGQYYTGEYLTGQSLSAWYTTGCTIIPGYWSGGSLDASWVQVGGEYIAEIQTGCTVVWQEMTGGYLTWGYRTWWTEICNAGLGTGDLVQTWTTETWTTQTWITQTWIIETWTIQQQNIVTLGNGICESGDIVWGTPVSWSFVRDLFGISWSYSWTDCLISWLSLQLRDHNNQWISLSSFASWTSSYVFDSKRLYSFQNSGFYNIIGNTGAGNFMLYTGQYSGSYSRLFSWYKLRLLTPAQTVISETSSFTIDNQSPTITWITLLSSWAATWYVAISWSVVLSFTASEELSWVQVTLWSGKTAASSVISWLNYTYTRNLTSLYTEGNLVASVSFADKAGNTWSSVYTSALVFDITRPIVSWFVFSEYVYWLRLNFTWSEAIRYAFNYQITWWTFITGASAEYLTAQQVSFSWIQRDQLYIFNLNVFDRAGNSRSVTGNFIRTNLWLITSNVSIVPIAAENVVSWSLATLAVVLKAEVGKFNVCKNALSYTPVELTIKGNVFTLQMPKFKKSQIKTLVNAFTLYVLDKIKNNSGITSDEITEVTKKFNSFLVVLKLIRDDDNICKQNLSNYHISQFKSVLREYNLNGLE